MDPRNRAAPQSSRRKPTSTRITERTRTSPHRSFLFKEFTMKAKFFAALLTALIASLSAPAFASGYGPAPFYRPSIGAPASQRGPSTETLAVERANVAD